MSNTLSTLPIIFTLSCFNEQARNSVDFWRPMAFIPNLNAGSLTYYWNSNDKKKDPATSVQDEHNCLRAAFASLRRLHWRVGINTTVMGRDVCCNPDGSTSLLETTLGTIDSLVTTMAVETSKDPIEIASTSTRKWIIHTHNAHI